MELTPISGSSHVKAIGYEDGAILAQYKDGAVYSWKRPPEIFAAFERAESKGRFLKLLGKGTRVGSEPVPAVATSPANSDVLNSLTNEADTCCWREFMRLGLAEKLDAMTTFDCPRCGQQYRPRATDGAIRHWDAHCWAASL